MIIIQFSILRFKTHITCCLLKVVKTSESYIVLSRNQFANILLVTHLFGNTSVVSKSSSDWLNYTVFPEDVCMSRSLTFRLETRYHGAKLPRERRKPSCLQM